jgi:ketosteroid isomerase-like protein
MHDREAQVRQLFDVRQGRDFEALAAMYTGDAEYLRPDGASQGREQIVAYQQAIMSAFPDHDSRLEAILTSGDAVTVEWVQTATHTQPCNAGSLGTIDPTGKSFEARIAEIFRFEGPQVASQHAYYDLLSLLGQLGWLDKFLPLFPGVLEPARLPGQDLCARDRQRLPAGATHADRPQGCSP